MREPQVANTLELLPINLSMAPVYLTNCYVCVCVCVCVRDVRARACVCVCVFSACYWRRSPRMCLAPVLVCFMRAHTLVHAFAETCTGNMKLLHWGMHARKHEYTHGNTDTDARAYTVKFAINQ